MTAAGAQEGRDARRELLDLVATMALALYSFVAALGLARVFADWQFLSDIVVVVLVGHGTSFVLRRLGVPGLVAVTLTAAALAWAIAWLAYPTTFAAVFPSRDTWDIAWADLNVVRDQFQHAVAPVEYVGGWSLLALIGAGFAVLAGDTFAFHARARGEALVPGAVFFVFVAALGADRHRLALTLALIATGAVTVAVLRMRFAQPPRTFLGGNRHPLAVTLPAAAMAGVAIVAGAWAIGPRLPGATAEPLVETHHSIGGVTEVLSPLVDIRSRLVNRADTQLFTITSGAPAYWRASGLPEFDGSTWGLPDRSLDDVDGALSRPAPGAAANPQQLVVAGLRGRLVPAAAEPVRASGEGLRWNAETSTLVRVDRDLEAGDRIDILSATPSFTPDELRAATSAGPPDPIYLQLPDGFPDNIAALASSITADASTTYDRMILLQDWFRSQFEYSLDVPQGHSTSAIEAFLRYRIGYCEQFAGTFAAMARSLGIPARVAVGYTPGLLQADGSRVVLGKNAHAWPEVWFDKLGWVKFEPTPGRGAPGAEGYTGVAPNQDESPATAGEGGGVTPGPENLPPISVPPVQEPRSPLDDPALGDPGASDPAFTGRVEDRSIDWMAALLVVIVGVAALAVPSIVRRWRHAHPSSDAARHISGLWTRALGAIEATGCRVDRSLTPLEQVTAIAPRLPMAARPLRSLAELTTIATYATDDELAAVAEAQVAGEREPRRWCRQVERIAADSMTTIGRVRRYFTVWT